MADFNNISIIEIDNKTLPSVRNINNAPVNQRKISRKHYLCRRYIVILVYIILITIVFTVPTVLVYKKKIKTNTTVTTTEAPFNNIITNTTKWKQNGTTIFHQFDVDKFSFDLNSMYIDDDEETIYISEARKYRVIKMKLNTGNFSVVAGGNGDGNDTHQLSTVTDAIIDKKTDSIIICDLGNRRIVRWSRQNPANGDIIISKIFCYGLAMDNQGYLYVTDWFKKEVRRWEIGVSNEGTIVAGGNGGGNHLRQFLQPTSIFVDKDYSVYVVDTTNHRVMKWLKNATQGIIVAGGNDNGNKLTQLFRPHGIVVDHLGNVYITDTYNHRVMRWINGAREGSIVVGGNEQGNKTNQLYLPSDLLFDKQGNLYVFDAANYRIQKFDIQSN